MEEFYAVASKFLIFFSVIIAIYYALGIQKSTRAYKVFTLYLIAMAIVQSISYYIGGVLRENNLFMFHYYYILQFYILSLFYYLLLKTRWVIYVTVVVTIVLVWMYVRDPGIFLVYSPLGVTLTQLILIAYIINYFYRSLSGKLRYIYINMGLFFFLLTSILVFASGNLMLDLQLSESKVLLLSYINEFTYFTLLMLVFFEWLKNHSEFLFKRNPHA